MKQLKTTLAILALSLSLFSCQSEPEKPLNVLMIAVDDLRPELGCYGNSRVHSPNIDQLASEGVLFVNSYCNIPVCGASRASLMTGTRPTKNRFLHYYTRADVEVPEAICLSQHFKNNAYYTISNGKIFHEFDDRAESWDENWRPETSASWRDYHINENIAMELDGGRGPIYEMADVHDTTYHDGKLAAKTIADLERLKESGKPFFLAAGFVKPHLPFTAPKKYWDMYSRESFKPTIKEFWPANAPAEAFHNSGELRTYGGIPEKGFVDDSISLSMQHGYYACVSYIDTQIGKVLAALENLDLAKNTIVILWGDHGWNLGEHGMWCKHCNFNTSLKAPLIIKVPGFENGRTSAAMVEFVDIFPTLSQLCDLDVPETVEGKSLVPLLKNPDTAWTDFVVSKYFDGISITTSEFAYTEFRDENDSLISNMLFDHTIDMAETNNLTDNPEYNEIEKMLSKKLLENRGSDYFRKNEITTKE